MSGPKLVKLEANEGAATLPPSTCQWCYINCCTYYPQKHDSLDWACLAKGSWTRCFHSLFVPVPVLVRPVSDWSLTCGGLPYCKHAFCIHPITLLKAVLLFTMFCSQKDISLDVSPTRRLFLPAVNLNSLILSYSNYQHYINDPPRCRSSI